MNGKGQGVCIYSVEFIMDNNRVMHRYVVVDGFYSEDQVVELVKLNNKTEASIVKIELLTDLGIHLGF